MLYPQKDDRFVAIDSVTSLMYTLMAGAKGALSNPMNSVAPPPSVASVQCSTPVCTECRDRVIRTYIF